MLCVAAEDMRKKLIFAISEILPEGDAASCNHTSKVSLPLLAFSN